MPAHADLSTQLSTVCFENLYIVSDVVASKCGNYKKSKTTQTD